MIALECLALNCTNTINIWTKEVSQLAAYLNISDACTPGTGRIATGIAK